MNFFPINFLVVLVTCLGITLTSNASDHADPLFNKKPEVSISGLFVFQDKDDMIIILNVYPGLNVNPPLELESYRYKIHIDTHTKVNFSNPENNQRYGGSIENPGGIESNLSITIQMDNYTKLVSTDIIGMEEPNRVKIWTGIRDDPFIFPKFFGTNVVSMILSIPFSAYANTQKDWLIWATAHKSSNMDQLDHVGRSNRTMNPRLDFINTLPPNKQLSEITEQHNDPGFFRGLLMKHLAPLFALRHYDLFPDVLIYTRTRNAGFPNGRRLTDDIAHLTCLSGDCLLWELSFADSEEWPRKTTNDKIFSGNFPFLAEPWPMADPGD